MAIYISEALYLGSTIANNNPIIGWLSCFTPTEVSSPDTEDGFSAAAVWSADTYSFWQSKAAGVSGASMTPQLVIENNYNYLIDYIAFVWQGSDANFLCEYSDDAITWETFDDDGEIQIKANTPVMYYFNAMTPAYVRITFGLAASEIARVAHVKVGNALILQRPRYVGDIPGGMNINVEKIGSKSYAGQHLGSVLISQGESFNITQENNTPEFVRSTGLQNFFKHAHRLIKLSNGPVETFFYAWRPKDYPNEIQYCGEVTSFDPPSNARSNGMMSWSMKGDAFR